MRLNYDREADAAFVYLDEEAFESGGTGPTTRLDLDRLLRTDRSGRLVAYEFLGVRRFGVRVDDLEHRDELRAILRDAGIPERDWSAPLDAARVRIVKKSRARSASSA